MPKQRINGRYNGSIASQTDGDDCTDNIYTQVGWQKDGEYVELFTIFPKATLVMPSGAKASFVQPGWCASLDRNGINELIKTLRKARDDAFGRDE